MKIYVNLLKLEKKYKIFNNKAIKIDRVLNYRVHNLIENKLNL